MEYKKNLNYKICTIYNGHTLDLLINKSDDNMLNNIKVYDPNISYHSAVMCDVSISKPQFRKEVICYRKLRSLDMESFLSDVADCPLVIDPSIDLERLVQQHYTLLRSIDNCKGTFLRKRNCPAQLNASEYILNRLQIFCCLRLTSCLPNQQDSSPRAN